MKKGPIAHKGLGLELHQPRLENPDIDKFGIKHWRSATPRAAYNIDRIHRMDIAACRAVAVHANQRRVIDGAIGPFTSSKQAIIGVHDRCGEIYAIAACRLIRHRCDIPLANDRANAP